MAGAATGALGAAEGAVSAATGAVTGGAAGPSHAGAAASPAAKVVESVGSVAKGALLSVGTGGPAVTAVQQMLASVEPGTVVSGLFDAGTAAAARAFQAANGLTADGVIGPKTLAALQSAASGLLSGGGTSSDNALGNTTRVLGDTPGDDNPEMTFGTFLSHLTRLQLAVFVAPACALRMFQELGHVPNFLGALGAAAGGDVKPLAAMIQREGACAVAFCLPSVITRGIVSYIIMGDKPRARKNLAHYMDGSGADLDQDVSALLRENPRIREKVKLAGEEAAAGDGHKDIDYIGQGDYSSEDWRYAIGNLDLVTVDVIDRSRRTMTVGLRDPYQWHPKEERSTQCLHEFFEAAKTFGAREYFAVGKTVTTY